MITALETKCHELVILLYMLDDRYQNSRKIMDLGHFADGRVRVEDIDSLRQILVNWSILNPDYEGFELTDIGKDWARDLIQEKEDIKNEIPENEITDFIDVWLPKISMYGEFTFTSFASNRFRIIQTTEQAQSLVDGQREVLVRNAAINYLIFEGFAKNRHDIDKGGGILYRELTDNGRQLKKQGSLRAFWDWERQEREKIEEKKLLELEVLRSQKDFQQLNNEFIGKQSDLIDNQIRTNTNVISTNKRVVLILIVTVLVAVISIIPPSIALKRDIDKDTAKDTINKQHSTIKSLELKLQKEETKSDSLRKVLILQERGCKLNCVKVHK